MVWYRMVSYSIGLAVKEVGCFRKLGVLFAGVLVMRALLFGVYIRAPDFRQLPFSLSYHSLDLCMINQAVSEVW